MRIEWLPSALNDLGRVREFLRPKNAEAAQRAVVSIKKAVAALEINPRLGKVVEDLPDFHDIIIPFAGRSYILRYRTHDDIVFIVAIRHSREVGFAQE